MKITRVILWSATSLGRDIVIVAAAIGIIQPAVRAETLLTGVGADNSVGGVEIRSTSWTGTVVQASNGSNYQISGPRGLIVLSNTLYLVNQNANTPLRGEILKFDPTTGSFLGKLVSLQNPNAPYAPHGIIAGPDNSLYTADQGSFDTMYPGRVARFDLQGTFLGNVDTNGLTIPFVPTGLVMGPDGMMYVSGDGNLVLGEISGYIFRFRFDSNTRYFHYLDTLVASTATNYYASGMHSPEGLAFGPDGKLYVASSYGEYLDGQGSFTVDRDRVLIFDTHGAKLGEIFYYAPNATRVYAQALLFGPRGDLFVPMTGDAGVRRYSAASQYQQFTLIPANRAGPQQPWYDTFLSTDPHTLSYMPPVLVESSTQGGVKLAWPAAQTGWQLQTQTNNPGAGPGSTWYDVPGSLSTNAASMVINRANSAVFFRLSAP